MHVCKVYTPYADAATVKAAAKGADLFVTLCMATGIPSRTAASRMAPAWPARVTRAPPMAWASTPREAARRSSTTVPNGSAANLHLAPNAIVLLSHMCFTSGNSEDYDKIPDYDLAVEHIDNFAQGFLASDG